MQSTTFGIDLGTTNSVAALWKNGSIEVLAYKTGSRLFPSCVAYNKKNPAQSIVGYFAKLKMQTTSYGVFHSCKRLLGVTYDNPIVAKMNGSVGYDIRNGADDKLVVAIQTESGDVVKHPEDVGAMILSAIAEEMKAYAGYDIRNAVITVPAYFDQYKRDLTKLAGQIAGLNVRAIISEPQAAAYAYLDFTNEGRDSTFMIYDLGGGTFDVTILRCEGDQFTELATDGDIFCGGLDFDKLILDEMKKRYMDETGEPIPAKLIAKVLSKCEQAKIALLTSPHTEIDITDDVIVDFTRAEMNRLIGPKLADTLKICDRAIAAAKITVSDIDSIILVGGSTRLLLVEELLKGHFPTIPIKGNISPDECVAYGAAKYGHNLDIHPDVNMTIPEPAFEVAELVPVFDNSPPPVPAPLCPPSSAPSSILHPPPVPGSVEEYILAFESRYPDLPPRDEHIPTPQPSIEQPVVVTDIGGVKYFARCPSDIGIANRGRMEVLIPRNTALPKLEKKLIRLRNVERPLIRIPLYQGNDPIAKNNGMLKRLEVKLELHKDAYLLIILDMKDDGSLSVRVVDFNTGDSYEYKDIQSAMSQEELRGRQDAVEQERRTRNYVSEMDNIRNRLQKWGFSLIEAGASEEDQKIINQRIRQLSRLESFELTEDLTDEIYNIFAEISERVME